MREFWAAIAGALIGGVFAVVAAYFAAKMTFANERVARAEERLDEALWRAFRIAADLVGLNRAGSLLGTEADQLVPQLNAALVEIQTRCTTKQAPLANTLDGLRRGITETIRDARVVGSWSESDRATALEYLEALGLAVNGWTDNPGKFVSDKTTTQSLLDRVRARDRSRVAGPDSAG